MATDRIRRTRGNERHPWEGMNNEELLRTLGLVLTDQHGNTGLTMAAVLLFGPDGMIASACPHLKTVCICRVYNLDSYDDCDVIAPTNLLDTYERMFDFGQDHLNDSFALDGIQAVSARDAILREIISNSLAHRDYSSAFAAQMVIEKDRILMENTSRTHGTTGILNLCNVRSFDRNPLLSRIFREIGLADEPGSGSRNCHRYSMLYSGRQPQFSEGKIFKTVIPLTTGALIKVGPLPPASSGSGQFFLLEK